MMFRSALALLVLAACFGVLTSTVTAGDDTAFVRKTFDVSAITTPHAWRYGPLLGARTDFDDRGERGPADGYPDPEAWLGGDELLDLLLAWGGSEVWEVDRVWMEYRENRLIVFHRPEVIRQVETILYELAVGASQRVLLHVEIQEKRGGEEGCRISGSLELPAGVTRTLAVTSRVDYVADYDVEIAQGSNISNPVQDHLDEGLVVEAMAHPLLDGKRVLLDAHLQFCCLDGMRTVDLGVDEEYIAEPYRSPDRFSTGTVQLPICSHADAHVSMIVSTGEDVLIPIVSGDRRATVRIHVDLIGDAGPDRVVGVSALSMPPLALRAGAPVESTAWAHHRRTLRIHTRSEEETSPLGSVDEVLELIHRSLLPTRWEEGDERLDTLERGAVRITARPDLVSKTRGFIQDLEAETLRPVVVDVAVLSVRDTVAPGPGGELDEELATLVTSTRLHTLSGRWASVRLGRTTNYLADYDAEVAQESRISDPITGQSFGGLVGNVKPHLPLAGRTVRVDLDLLFSQDELVEEAFDSGIQYMGPIEQVRARRTRIHTSIGVPLGGRTLLDAGPDPDRPGSRLVLAVSAKTP